MELRFGEVKSKYVTDGVEVEETRKIRDYMTAQSIRSFTIPVKVSSFDEVRQEFDDLIKQAENGECLDISLNVRIDKNTGLPQMVKKTILDKSSRL